MSKKSKVTRREKRAAAPKSKAVIEGERILAEHDQDERDRARTMQAAREKIHDNAAKLAADAEIEAVRDMEKPAEPDADLIRRADETMAGMDAAKAAEATQAEPEKTEPRKRWWNL